MSTTASDMSGRSNTAFKGGCSHTHRMCKVHTSHDTCPANLEVIQLFHEHQEVVPLLVLLQRHGGHPLMRL